MFYFTFPIWLPMRHAGRCLKVTVRHQAAVSLQLGVKHQAQGPTDVWLFYQDKSCNLWITGKEAEPHTAHNFKCNSNFNLLMFWFFIIEYCFFFCWFHVAYFFMLCFEATGSETLSQANFQIHRWTLTKKKIFPPAASFKSGKIIL